MTDAAREPARIGRADWPIGAVVLAAGRSTRMGPENKLLRAVRGVPMICRAVDAFLEARVDPVVVVTGHEEDLVRAALGGRRMYVVHNSEHELGMSTSLRVGLQALPDDLDGVVVGLGDMPWVLPEHIDALVEAFDPDGPASICVPVHDGERGNPVLWAGRYLAELKRLTGDAGAKSLLARYADSVHRVELDDPGVLRDVDTPDALVPSGDLAAGP